MSSFAINPPSVAIVYPDTGKPTAEGYKFLLAIQRTIGEGLLNQIQEGNYLTFSTSAVLSNSKVLTQGAGLSFTTVGSSVTVSLAASGVTAASYGSASKTLTLTIDQYGRITAATESVLNTNNITEGGSNLYFTDTRARAAFSAGGGIVYNSTTGGFSLTTTGVTAGTYSPPASITVDAYGRILAIS